MGESNKNEQNEILNAFPTVDYKTVMKDEGTTFPKMEIIRCDDKGMSLRDYFAAKAIASLPTMHPDYYGPSKYYEMAQDAYRIADAMIEARVSPSSD